MTFSISNPGLVRKVVAAAVTYLLTPVARRIALRWGAMTGALIASVIAYGLANGAAVRFTMSAFELQIDSLTLLIGNGIALCLGAGGALPPAIRIFRLSVVDGLKSV